MSRVERSVYEKAREIVDDGRVTLTDETKKAIYLEVKGTSDTYGVRLQRDHTFACTCPFATLKGLPKGALCSHAVAAILFVAEQEAP